MDRRTLRSQTRSGTLSRKSIEAERREGRGRPAIESCVQCTNYNAKPRERFRIRTGTETGKRKCDGRPCSHCSTLGLECKDPGGDTTACDSCSYHKQKCELEAGNTNCLKCQRRGCECVFSKKSRSRVGLSEQVHSMPEELEEVETEPMSPEESVHPANLQTEEEGVVSESTPSEEDGQSVVEDSDVEDEEGFQYPDPDPGSKPDDSPYWV